MKLMHISDLHIGKKIKNISMAEEQEYILRQIEDIVKNEKPDALLISGDVYDKPTPSDKAIEMFDNFIFELSQSGTKMFIISGNHDSAERIAFLNRIVSVAGIYIAPVYDGNARMVTLEDEYGPVNVYMLPFVKPPIVRHAFDEEDIDTYTDAVGAAIKHMNVDKSQRNVIVSHQYVTGSSNPERAESELNVGGLDNVDASVYEDFDYVAMGHLHRPQNVNCNTNIRYCGTPLKYSFSEANDVKSVTMVELGPKGTVDISTIPLNSIRDFVRIEGDFYGILSDYEGSDNMNYFEVTLTNEQPVLDAFRRLQRVLPNILVLKYNNIVYSENQEVSAAPDTVSLTEIEIIDSLFSHINNQPMSEVQREYMESVIKKLKEGSLYETN